MATLPTERRLAAILAADVVGYSRLMGNDEIGTLRALKALHADLLEPMIDGHRGRVVKTAGDGLLAEFGSVVDAVTCAAGIQHEMSAPAGDHRLLTLRIGLNLGDIIIDGEDIFGDGVNVAARLEGICEPGGLAISRAAHDQVRDKLDLPFVDLGEHNVKNIARPIQVFGIGPRAIADLPAASLTDRVERPERPARGDGPPRGERSTFRKWRRRAILTAVALFVLWHQAGVRHAVSQIVAWATVGPDKPSAIPPAAAPKPEKQLAPLPAPIEVSPAPGSPPGENDPGKGPASDNPATAPPVQLHPSDQ